MTGLLGQISGAFVNPAMLSALGLASVPLIIHLLSRRRFKRLAWAATRFLLEADRENRRRVRFEQWLLVALRCIAMALLALLVARPFLQPGLLASFLGTSANAQRIIVLDDSASTRYRAGSEPEFAKLRAAAVRLVSWLHQEAPSEPISIYLTSRPDEPLVRAGLLTDADAHELRARLEKVTPVERPARPHEVLSRIASELLPDRKRATQIYLLSDLQRSDWLPQQGVDVFEPLRRAAEERGSSDAPLRAVLVGGSDAPRANVAITALSLDRPQAIAGVPCIIRATLANHSLRQTDPFSLQVTVDGAPQPAVKVEPLAAESESTALFEITLPDPGFHELQVTTDGLDQFAIDDARAFALPVKETLGVLIVNGQPAATPADDETYFLRNALAPSGQFSSGLRVETIDPDQLEGADLNSFDVVLICNAAAPGPGAIDSLQRFVMQGGGLAFFLGAEVGPPEEYNRLLYAEGAGLLPVALDATADAPGNGVGLVRTSEHPVTAMFPAGSDALSEYVRFRRFYRVKEPPAEVAANPEAAPTTRPTRRGDALVLARFTDPENSAALIERPFGRGRVILFTSTVDAEWNDWVRAVDGSYLVTLLELVQHIARRPEHPAALTIGQGGEIALSPDLYELTATLKPPTAESSPLTLTPRDADVLPGQPVTIEIPPLLRLGAYRLDLTGRTGQAESRPLIVNFDPAESDLRVAASAELAPALRGVPFEIVASADEFLLGEEETRRELWPSLLVALTLVLLGEHALAWWFGGYSTGRRRWFGG